MTDARGEVANATLEVSIVAAAPVIESVTPASGPAGGGTAIKIAGSGFAEGLTVVIGDVQATDVVVESETNLGVVVPPGAAGIVDVTVIKSRWPANIAHRCVHVRRIRTGGRRVRRLGIRTVERGDVRGQPRA